jgi:PKD repeat protein
MAVLQAFLRSIVALFLLLALAPLAVAQPSFQTQDTFRAIPTFHSMGLYWAPAGKGADRVARVEYKVMGAPDSTYKRGLDLWYDFRTPGNGGMPAGEYRGSLVHLQPGTAYDLRLTLVDEDGATVGSPVTINATPSCTTPGASCTKTWSETFPTGTEKQIASGSISAPIEITPADSGSATGYTVITAAGPIDGSGIAPVGSPGTNGSCIIIRPGTHHVILRGLVVRNCANSAIHIPFASGQGQTRDIVIEDSEFSGYGNGDTDAGVHCNHFSNNSGNQESARPERLIIQKNKFHSPRHSALAWWFDHPVGPNAIELNRCAGNHVIRYNEVYTENGNFFKDGIGSVDNFTTNQNYFHFTAKGAPYADTDIYGNLMTHIYDDAFEAEGANRNVRIWENYFDRIFVPIGNVNNAHGPLYVWRNVSNSMGGMNMEPLCGNINDCPAGTQPAAPDDEGRGGFIKAGGRSTEQRGGRAYFFHNTILQPPPASCGGEDLPCGAGWAMNAVQRLHYNFWSHNNIWQIHKPQQINGERKFSAILANCNEGSVANQNECRLSHDLYNNGPINAGGVTQTEPSGWRTETPTYAASGNDYPGAAAQPSSTNDWEGNFKLQPGTIGHGQAKVLFNFNDQYANPDVGAHQSGTTMKFGRAAAGIIEPPGPTAALSTTPSPASGSVPLPVTFTSNSTPGAAPIATLRLDFGDGSTPAQWTDQGTSQPHTYTAAGNYTATLTVTDTNNRTDTASVPVTVTCTPAPTAVLAATPTSGNRPLTVNFDASGSSAAGGATITSYSINYGDNTGSGSGVSQSHQYTGVGQFTATLMVTDSNGCQSQPDTETITVTDTTGTTEILQDGLNGYAGTTDTHGLSDAPGSNFGDRDEWSIGYNPNRFLPLMRFRIFVSEGGPVPNGATITSATLTLTKTDGQDGVLEVRRLLRDWHELQANWTQAANGASWQVAGALGAADIAAAADGQATIGAAAGTYNINVTASVQAFASGAPNYGWRFNQLSGSNSIKDFRSREYATPSVRPKLTVTYTSQPSGQTVTLRDGLGPYVGTSDTAGNVNQPGAGYGSHPTIFIGYDNTRFMTLMRFKIFAAEGGPVPNGATISSATLSLNKTAGQNGVVEAKRMLKNWHETQATWTNAATGTPWQVPGALGATDVAASGDGQASIPAGNGWFNIDVTPSVQAFASGTPNYGWRINHVSGPNSIKDFSSRNHGTADQHPTLTIIYTTN